MWYGQLADVIVAIHAAYVSYVVCGQLAIFAGVVCRWQWIRNVWFRVTHLVAVSIVSFEAIMSIPCPLTVWEQNLRALGGVEPTGETFLGRMLHGLIFYGAPPWVFTSLYVGFGLLVAATFVVAPPRWTRVATTPE